ncbi:urokinase plasminogen activator surface receptor-like [Betta splendens]|uniref:Urokinase plasminogen activator surface receptor-like n=1 Tax=Betta splendens TaxID=158456 RepID=A0A6P7MHC6_BETSP|nr:urokinase plasminogen activator surface receptor-like [Betta splendens]
MKLILGLSLVWTLLSAAAALQCLTCTDTQCSNTTPQTCSSEAACVTAAIQASTPATTVQQLWKTCAQASVCAANGSTAFSLSTTGLKATAASQCCSTDNCNAAAPSLPGAQAPNSFQCFSCDFTDGNCSTRIQCRGIENNCFRASVTIGASTSLTLGCVSSTLCAAASSFTLPVVQTVSNITCCGTSLCNSAPAAATASACLLLGLLALSRC